MWLIISDYLSENIASIRRKFRQKSNCYKKGEREFFFMTILAQPISTRYNSE